MISEPINTTFGHGGLPSLGTLVTVHGWWERMPGGRGSRRAV